MQKITISNDPIQTKCKTKCIAFLKKKRNPPSCYNSKGSTLSHISNNIQLNRLTAIGRNWGQKVVIITEFGLAKDVTPAFPL